MYEKLFYRLKRLNYFIKNAKTGRPKEFAAKLKISERQLYEHINAMKKAGAPIYFCRRKNSYCYIKPGNFNIGFEDFTNSLLENFDSLDLPVE